MVLEQEFLGIWEHPIASWSNRGWGWAGSFCFFLGRLSHISEGGCVPLSLLNYLWRQDGAGLGHRWGVFPSGYSPKVCPLIWGQQACYLEKSLLSSVTVPELDAHSLRHCRVAA